MGGDFQSLHFEGYGFGPGGTERYFGLEETVFVVANKWNLKKLMSHKGQRRRLYILFPPDIVERHFRRSSCKNFLVSRRGGTWLSCPQRTTKWPDSTTTGRIVIAMGHTSFYYLDKLRHLS